jgi:hypothetical protein
VTPFRCLAMLCLFLITMLSCAPATAGETVNTDDQMLFDIRLDTLRMGDGARGYPVAGGICVDFDAVASALDVAVEISPDRQSATGWVFDEHNILKVNRTSMDVRSGGRIKKLKVGDIVDADGGWCVETRVLADWLGISIDVDPLNALLLVHSEKKLPAEAAAGREASANLIAAQAKASASDGAGLIPRLAIPYRAWRTPNFDITASIGHEKRALTRSFEVFAAGELAWMSADARVASDNNGTINAVRARLYRSDPDARVLGPLHATEFALGDVNSIATRLVSGTAAGRGVSLTNRPLSQATQFDTTTFRGDLPIGWDVELYRNGELIALFRARNQGRYEFVDVPLIYGTNAFEIVRHGPQGQTRRERRLFEVGATAVPPGALWWWADAVQKNRDLFGFESGLAKPGEWRTGAGIDYGVGLRTSASLSVQSMVDGAAGARKTYVEAELRRALGPVIVTVTGAGDLSKGRAASVTGLGRLLGFRFSFNARINDGMSSELVDRADRSTVVVQLDRDVTFGRLVLPVHFDLTKLNRVDGTRGQNYAARTSFSLAGLSTTLAVRASRAAAAGEGYGPIDGAIGLLFSGKFHKVALRGEINYRLGTIFGPVDTRLTAEWSPSIRDQWQLGAGYSWQSRAASASFGYSHSFDRFSVTSSFNGESTGNVSARVNLLFSLGSDARGHFGRVSADRLASSGSVAVNIYRDENGDGRRGRDEPIEREAQIRVANQPIRNAVAGDGTILVGGLTPAATVSVAIDPSSLSDPLLDPSQKAINIVPRRGLTAHLDLAVTASGLIEGNLAGTNELVATNVAIGLFGLDGKEIARTTTDYDGSFLFEKVRYGRYRVVIGPSEAGPVQSIDVKVDASNPIVRLRNLGPSIAPPVSAM